MRRLLDDYLAELAQFGEVDLVYPWLDAYWQPGEKRWPYVIAEGDRQIIGFALVNVHAPSGEPVDYAMAEFYVAPEARRSGVGRAAAESVFHRHPGTWELSAMHSNAGARRFWIVAIAAAGASDLTVREHGDLALFRFRIA